MSKFGDTVRLVIKTPNQLKQKSSFLDSMNKKGCVRLKFPLYLTFTVYSGIDCVEIHGESSGGLPDSLLRPDLLFYDGKPSRGSV